jgi:hypothetical protein
MARAPVTPAAPIAPTPARTSLPPDLTVASAGLVPNLMPRDRHHRRDLRRCVASGRPSLTRLGIHR